MSKLTSVGAAALWLALGFASVPGCTSTEPAGPAPAPSPAPAPTPTPPPPPAQVGAQQVEVALEESYKVAKDDAEVGGITHMPAVAFSGDGKRLFTATSAGKAIVFAAADRAIKAKVDFGAPPLRAAAFAGEAYVVALGEKSVRVTDLKTLKQAGEIALSDGGGPTALATSADARHVVLGRLDGAIEVRSLPSLALVKRLEGAHKGEVTALAIAAGAKLVASAGRDGKLALFTFPALEAKQAVEDGSPLHAVAFSPDGKRLAFGGERNTIRELDLASGKDRTIATGQPFWITALGYSPDGTTLAAGDESCDVWLFDTAAPKTIFHGKHHGECWVNSVAWTPDGERFVFGCRPNSLAGVPAQWAANVAVEAHNSKEVKASAAACAVAEDACFQAWVADAAKDGDKAKLRADVRSHLAKQSPDKSDKAIDGLERQWLAGRSAPTAGRMAGGGAGGAVLSLGDAGGPSELTAGGTGLYVLDISGSAAGYDLNESAEGFAKGTPVAPAPAPSPELAALRKKAVEEKALAEKVAQVETAQKAQAETYQTRVAELQKSFLVNEWRFAKKK